ncbi:hypothetical protein J6590_034696 [Homalodisca vitripennis]|nr:hypothetical protein J6590_094186 [Homalodisca vitripennis]KAG8302383.1 hypothetical protein J6590_034696 [Homalodisca vitripennis]
MRHYTCSTSTPKVRAPLDTNYARALGARECVLAYSRLRYRFVSAIVSAVVRGERSFLISSVKGARRNPLSGKQDSVCFPPGGIKMRQFLQSPRHNGPT